MNRLLRQYFPKGNDLAASSQAELNRTALQLNQPAARCVYQARHASVTADGELREPHPHRIDDHRAALGGPGLLGVEQIDLGEPLDATLDRVEGGEHLLRRVRTTRRIIAPSPATLRSLRAGRIPRCRRSAPDGHLNGATRA